MEYVEKIGVNVILNSLIMNAANNSNAKMIAINKENVSEKLDANVILVLKVKFVWKK